MRHLLGMLNGTDQPPALAPQPTLAEIGELVARARAAGLPTVLESAASAAPLPAGLDLAAYRIVQEALTNALKHAGRRAHDRHRRLVGEHALDARDPRPRRGAAAQRRRRPRPGGHARARAALRRRARSRPRRRRRLARARDPSASTSRELSLA